MFDKLKKLKYGARVLLSRSGGQPETIDVAGRSIVLMHGGEGTPPVGAPPAPPPAPTRTPAPAKK